MFSPGIWWIGSSVNLSGGWVFVGVIEEAFDGGFLDGPVPPFELSVGPGMVGLGQRVADAMTKTDAIEGMSTPRLCVIIATCSSC
jgi:hypothetical protein